MTNFVPRHFGTALRNVLISLSVQNLRTPPAPARIGFGDCVLLLYRMPSVAQTYDVYSPSICPGHLPKIIAIVDIYPRYPTPTITVTLNTNHVALHIVPNPNQGGRCQRMCFLFGEGYSGTDARGEANIRRRVARPHQLSAAAAVMAACHG